MAENLFRRFFRALRRSTPARSSDRMYFAPRAHAGLSITHDTALRYSAVWGCVRVIAESLAQMSWHVYRRTTGGGKEMMTQHPVDWLLHRQWNPELSAFGGRETLIAWALTWGNGYAEIERDAAGRAVWLWPIAPDRVKVERTAAGALVYDVTNHGEPNSVLAAEDMLHLHGLSFDGVTGYSVIALARESIGLGLATERFGAAFFGNGSHPGGVLEHPGKLNPEARQNLKSSWEDAHRGPDNVLRVAVLEEGMKWQAIGIPPEDAQFLETRKFQVQEICRWFRVPPHKLADLERATFSNIEHQAIEFVVDTLVPWAVRLEQEADLKLFGANRGRLFTKLNVNALLRGAQENRFGAYATGRQWGWLSVNDVRALEDMNPLPPHIGDTYLVPINMLALSLTGDRPTLPLAPAAAEDEPPDAEDVVRAALAAQLAAARTGTQNGGLH
jgi:HK97 family phage portal protein